MCPEGYRFQEDANENDRRSGLYANIISIFPQQGRRGSFPAFRPRERRELPQTNGAPLPRVFWRGSSFPMAQETARDNQDIPRPQRASRQADGVG